jgi:glycosyltransferase involved in cell wall biosynthesis
MQRRLFFSPDMQDAIDQAVATTRYRVAILESSFLGYYRLPPDMMVVLDQHNVESEILYRSGRQERSRMRRVYNMLEYVKYRADEVRFCRRADLIIATSERDRMHMVNWGDLPPCVVIPNGVDTGYFSSRLDDAAVSAASVVFTGTMSYAPNAEAVLYFAHDIWPSVRRRAPEATLAIVGQGPPPVVSRLAELPGITVTGSVPDVRPYIAGAQVVVAPLRIGGGTRLKILEAMAMSRAVVSSSIGCEGLDVEDGRHLLIADEPASFAARVVDLLSNPEQRSALGCAGRRLVEERYDWATLGAQLRHVLLEWVGNTGQTQSET